MIEEDQAVMDIDRRWRWRGAGWLLIAVVLAFLTVGVWVAVGDSNDANHRAKALETTAELRDKRITNLEIALKAQRAQFQACKDKKATAPGCREPIAPPPEAVTPELIEGKTGPRGPSGVIGLQGPRGPRGLRGFRGLPGDKGDTGDTGDQGPAGPEGNAGATGDKGEQGPQGEKGEQGPQGPQGPQGETGAQGPEGPVGPSGPTGADAPRIVDVFFGTDPANCTLVIVLSDGTSYAAGAPAVFCTPPPS